MERDFLGLNSKDTSLSIASVKEEVSDGSKDQVYSGMHWAFSNKVSALPLFMSFKAEQEEGQRKIVFDPLATSAFQPISPSDVLDSKNKLSSGVSQKMFNLDRQAAHFEMQACPFHSFNAGAVSSAYRSNEIRTIPVSNFSMANPFFKNHGAMGSPVKHQPLGGIPVAAPYPTTPIMGSVAGTYAPRNSSKPVAAPAQLTIFYAGKVNVFDDISPEKAQAIMALAGNGSSMTANAANPRAQVPALTPKNVLAEGIRGNLPCVMSPCSGLSSPMSVTSRSGDRSVGASSNTDDLIAIKTAGALAPTSQLEKPIAVTSIGSTTGTLMPAAVPQARKASLARFLEKRKERVTNAAPYSCNKPMEDAGGSDVAGKSQTALINLSNSK